MTPEQEMESWEAFERYRTGKMTGPEKDAFEQEMRQNPERRRELENNRKTQQVMEHYFIEQRMRETLQQLQQREEETRQRRWASRYRRLGIYGGSLAAACLLLYLTFAPVSLPDAGYDVTVTRSADSAQLSLAQRRAFGHFFEGQAHMAEGQYVRAVYNFEQVLQSEDLRPYFREAAQWHLAVSYLRSGQPYKAGKLYASLNDCEACEYRVNWLNRLKMRWQITWQQWMN